MNISWPERSILRVGTNASSPGHILSHNYSPTTFLNLPNPGIIPQESVGKCSPMGNHKVCPNYRIRIGTLGVRWPDSRSWPLAICFCLSFGIKHSSGVKHRYTMLIIHHHGNRCRRCTTNSCITPWGVRVLHGFGNGSLRWSCKTISSTLSSSWIAWSTRSLNAPRIASTASGL